MTTLAHPHDLFTLVPFIMGEHPENSIVFISIRDESAGIAMRIDYPTTIDVAQFDLITHHVKEQGADKVLVVLYCPDRQVAIEDLLSVVKNSLSESNIAIADLIIVKNGSWRSLVCDQSDCCPASGRALPQALTLQEFQQRGALAINDLIALFKEKNSDIPHGLIATVLASLTDLQVRDYAIGVASEPLQPTMLLMWKWLMEIAPQGFISPVATLYSELAYENGDRISASKALETAFVDTPNYPLAKLLQKTYSKGWPPESFKEMRSQLHPKICESLFGADEKE